MNYLRTLLLLPFLVSSRQGAVTTGGLLLLIVLSSSSSALISHNRTATVASLVNSLLHSADADAGTYINTPQPTTRPPTSIAANSSCRIVVNSTRNPKSLI